MRLTTFLSGSEAPRPFCEAVAERRAFDPNWQLRERTKKEITRLEAEGKQLEAEALRCSLHENMR